MNYWKFISILLMGIIIGFAVWEVRDANARNSDNDPVSHANRAVGDWKCTMIEDGGSLVSVVAALGFSRTAIAVNYKGSVSIICGRP